MLRHPVLLLALLTIASAAVADESSKRPPLSFGVSKSPTEARGFDQESDRKVSDQSTNADKAFARGLMKRHDANGNRVLEGDEWNNIKNAEKADYNGDKRITFDELLDRVSMKRRETVLAAGGKTGDRKSYRLVAPHEKLPEDLPGWFTQKDANRDGQVAMHEYSRRWTDSTARRFIALDQNDDGVVTAVEARIDK